MMVTNNKLLIYESRDDSNQCTHIPRLVRVWSQTICISCDQCIATFRKVVNNGGQSHCSRGKGLPTQSTAHRVIDPWIRTQFLSQDSHRISGGKAPSIDGRLLDLPDPYHRYAIDTFNTYSRGPTHRSLTDTGGGYNQLRVLPGLRLSNLNIASREKVV
jgi:predicted nucleic acid-binding Zn ribbon protein